MEKAIKNITVPQIAGGKKYILPPWRINEILLEVFSVLSEEEYYKEGFDYKRMIEGMGIKVKKFSSFSPENLERFKENSLSLWNEGVCLLFPDDETGKQLRMIAYNDSHNATETMQIILHEFAHIRLRHTQQSINGEVEATCFSIAMSLMFILEEKFHIGMRTVQLEGKDFFMNSIREYIGKKEVA